MKTHFVFCLGIMIAFGMAHADGKKNPKMHKFGGQGYADGGCGLGSVIFGAEKGFKQVLAVTTNASSFTQLFGISTGTLNCDEKGLFAKTTAFVETNKTALESSIVRGQGETLATLGELLDCKNSSFNAELKRRYTQTFPEGGATSEQITALAAGSCHI